MPPVTTDPPKTVPANPPLPMRAKDHLALSAYWFGANFLFGALLLVVVPAQIAQIVPDNKAEAQGRLLGIGALTAVVVPLLVGALSDRNPSKWGRRRPYMVVGTALNLLGLVVLYAAAASKNFWFYFGGYQVVQLGSNIATGAYSGIIPDLVPESQRGEASGWMAAMTQFGTILGAVGGGVLAQMHYLSLSYLCIALALSGSLAWTVFGVRERPLDHVLEPFRFGAFLRSLWIDPRKYPDFAWVWITRFLFTLGVWSVQPFIQYYLSDIFEIKNAAFLGSMLLALILVGATITGVLGGKVSDRVGRKKVVYVANTIIALASLAFIFSPSLPVTFAIGMVYGLGFGAYYSVDWALGCDVLPNKEDAAKDMGVWHISMTLPQSLAAPLGAWALALYGKTEVVVEGEKVFHYSHAGYTLLFCLSAAFLGLGAVLLRNVKGVR